MTHRTFWGLGVLILLLGTAFVFITVRDRAEIRQLKKEAAEAKKLEKSMKEQPVAKADELPPAKPGYKWVPHGGHFHQVPIDAPDTWQGEPHEPKSQDSLSGVPKFKLDLPDEIPEKFPTEAELREMDGEELAHLARLYTKASNELRKTDPDPDAGTRLYNATIPILFKIIDERADKAEALSEAHRKEYRKEFPVPRSYPATEESPAVHIDTKPPKKGSNEGGKQ